MGCCVVCSCFVLRFFFFFCLFLVWFIVLLLFVFMFAAEVAFRPRRLSGMAPVV